MNFLSGSYDSSKNDVFVSFNQDSTSLAVSSEKGYRILSLTAIDELEEINESDAEEICMVERLFSSSLLAIVHLNTPRKLTIYHFKKGTEICNYSYSNTILAVRLNRARLVVCLEEALYIHNIRDMVVIHTIRDTPPNPTGVIALSSDSDSCFLAYPGSSTIGEVQIFDTVNLHCKTMIAAHNSPLAAMAFTANGDMIATASEKGTVMRVFKISDGTKLHEFRRGIKRCATIFGLAFSPDAAFLASTSNTETVHVFKLDDTNPSVPPMGEDGSQGWMGYLSKAVALSASYLPLPQLGVSEVLTQGRSFAVARLPEAGQRNICALAVIQKALRLLVASSEGLLYIYNIDKNSGGDCILTKQHSLIKKPVPSTEPPRSLRGGPSEAPGDSSAIDDDPRNSGSISSYAGILRGDPQGIMSESEKFREMSLATKKPEKGAFKLEDNDEFPPMSSKHD